MKHKTQTMLGELRQGDRFYFPKNIYEVWQVIEKSTTGVVINQFLSDKKVHKYDEIKRAITPVVFLRHTIPAPGETWNIYQLRRGDVFMLEGDILTEYMVAYNNYPGKLTIDCFFWGDEEKPVEIEASSRVVFCYNVNENMLKETGNKI